MRSGSPLPCEKLSTTGSGGDRRLPTPRGGALFCSSGVVSMGSPSGRVRCVVCAIRPVANCSDGCDGRRGENACRLIVIGPGVASA